MSQISDIWKGLSKREQLILGAGIILASVILLYSFVFSPWQTKLTQLRDQAPQKRADLHWMKTQAKQAKSLLAATKSSTVQGPLLTTLENTAQETAIRGSIKRMQPGSDGEVKVWLSDVQFDLWLAWVDVLRQQVVDVSTATITRAEQGAVNVRATFSRS